MRDFDSDEGFQNEGTLYVFPVFETERLGQRIRPSPANDLFRVSLAFNIRSPATQGSSKVNLPYSLDSPARLILSASVNATDISSESANNKPILRDYPYIKRVRICLDRGEAGQKAANQIAEKLLQQNIE